MAAACSCIAKPASGPSPNTIQCLGKIETTQDAHGWKGRGKVCLARVSRHPVALQYQGLPRCLGRRCLARRQPGDGAHGLQAAGGAAALRVLAIQRQVDSVAVNRNRQFQS